MGCVPVLQMAQEPLRHHSVLGIGLGKKGHMRKMEG